MRERLDRLEEGLRRVPGVAGAAVVGTDAPTEIHIVASPDRPPKQIVRDVQSLAAASFDLKIDHRIVSVVQQLTAQPTPPEPAPRNGHRPAIDRVIVATKGDAGWVKVTLRWPDGEVSEGAGHSVLSREARARAAADAMVRALAPGLEATGASLVVDQLIILPLGSADSVTLRASYRDRDGASLLVGSALIADDAASAGARAVLHAVNRQLR